MHLLYDDLTGAGRLFGLVGYTVNLPWAKREYFAELVRQVSQIGGQDGGLALTLTNSQGAVVTPLPQRRPRPDRRATSSVSRSGSSTATSRRCCRPIASPSNGPRR